MTAPAPRNHPTEDAHPAPTPAPVAVPKGGFPQVRGYCPACGGESLYLAAGGYVTCSRLLCDDPVAPTEALEHRSEPVVAPPPSEAGALVLATIGPRTIPLELQATGVWLSPGRHGSYIAADIDSWVRLVPEDDEDTVRVPREALERLRAAVYTPPPEYRTTRVVVCADLMFQALDGTR